MGETQTVPSLPLPGTLKHNFLVGSFGMFGLIFDLFVAWFFDRQTQPHEHAVLRLNAPEQSLARTFLAPIVTQ